MPPHPAGSDTTIEITGLEDCYLPTERKAKALVFGLDVSTRAVYKRPAEAPLAMAFALRVAKGADWLCTAYPGSFTSSKCKMDGVPVAVQSPPPVSV